MRNNLFMAPIAALATGCFMLTTAPVANADANTDQISIQSNKAKKGTKSGTKCDKAPGSFVAPNGITVLNIKTCFNVKILKKMGCNTEAGKIERPAPPRDPKSKCKGKARVTFKLKYETPDCPTGYIGGKLKLKLNITQKLKALGLSKSIATGRVDTWAKTKIKIHDKFKGEVSNDCVWVPIVTPPPPPVPEATFSCDKLVVNKGAGRSVTIGAFSTSQSNGATFKNAVIEWGDGSSETFVSPVGRSHTFGSDDTYTIRATAVFDVNGQERRATSASCQSVVAFNTPPPPTEEDTPPEMTCTGMEHIFVGEDRTAFDFDAFDPDGDPFSFGETVITGPLLLHTTYPTVVVNGKQRRTLDISAKEIPEGTSEVASVTVHGTANGEPASCTVHVTVTNERTGWKASA